MVNFSRSPACWREHKFLPVLKRNVHGVKAEGPGELFQKPRVQAGPRFLLVLPRNVHGAEAGGPMNFLLLVQGHRELAGT